MVARGKERRKGEKKKKVVKRRKGEGREGEMMQGRKELAGRSKGRQKRKEK